MQKEIKNINHIYFLGIGGIGMSALARYFHSQGYTVAGYDRTSTPLTLSLEKEGISIHYEDKPSLIPDNTELVIYTPAIPAEMNEYRVIKQKGLQLLKRSEVLGLISLSKFCIAVAGSHGKTTTSSMIAHMLHSGKKGCLAFLGGIAKNYNSNLISDPESDILVAEADEFDRSFLHLNPSIAVITAVDPDHMDIYGNMDSLKSAFIEFIHQIKPGGILLLKKGVELNYSLPEKAKEYTYGFTETADFHPVDITLRQGRYYFRLQTPSGISEEYCLNMPGYINIENACAALAVCSLTGITLGEMVPLLESYQGVLRRLDKCFETQDQVYYDDYAHHPKELEACIASVRKMYPDRKITGVFQPHLFTRTRDLADEFAVCLSELDHIVLLDIYPAREEPIPGITSEFLLEKIQHPEKHLLSKTQLLEHIRDEKIEVLLTLGAGDIDQLVEPIVGILKQRNKL
ncbi:MAG: UDP-N-acetylmuramate--L-alanine ligase [Bacteroidales bacterium]